MLNLLATVWLVAAVVQGIGGHFEAALGCAILACMISFISAMECL
jgi:hypothetical protein